MENKSAAVPQAQQAEEIRARWLWVEPSVWTDRMLTVLENGIEGGKWFRLYDKVFSERNLQAAFQQVAKNDGAPGVDHVTVREFARRSTDSIRTLSDTLKRHTFTPQAIRRVQIPKLGTTETRPLGIPTVRDRVVQASIVNVIEPIFERDFAKHSYGFRPGRGCQDALRRVNDLLKAGYVHVIDADLKAYFDTIPHPDLMDRLRTKIADGRVLSLIESFLTAGIMEGLRQWTPERGAPQGAVLSPLLSNVYLDPLDHLMAASGFEMVRYADDFVILCRTADDASRALELVKQWTTNNGLLLHPTKTKIIDSRTTQFDFLGYTFCGEHRWPREKSTAKVKTTLRPKTRRNSGISLQCIVHNVNQTLRGWFTYFKHSTYPSVFRELDGWIRMRLRSILRRRQGLRGHGRGADHQRWTNAFFAEHGYFSLEDAYRKFRQSSQR